MAQSRLSERAQQVGDSMTLAITARANQLRMEGADVISLAAGESDFSPPEAALRESREALGDGFHRYTPSAGITPLRRAVARQYERRGLDVDPASEVIATAGGKQALYNALQVLCDPGDEVLVPVPYWVSYPEQIRLAGATPVFVPPTPELGIDLRALEQAITDRTRVVIVNSPSNPSGVVLGDDQLTQLAELVKARDLFVISDEIYEHLTYDGRVHRSIVADFGLRDRGLIVSGASKTLAVTGWRIGWAVGPSEVIAAMGKLQAHSTSCPNSIAQRGVLGALLEDQKARIAEMVEAYNRRRYGVVARLRELPGVSVVEPGGAFYAFPNVSKLYGKTAPGGAKIDGSIAFCQALLEQHNVAIIPGVAFGADDHVRLSYATSESELERGLDRMAEFIAALS